MGKIKIVFICVENARRSQMAQGFAEVFGGEKV
jgi:protein-tyrosine-phosphatase